MNAIATISKNAKVIRKANPRLSWQEAIKKASAVYKSKTKVSGVAPAAQRKKTKPKNVLGATKKRKVSQPRKVAVKVAKTTSVTRLPGAAGFAIIKQIDRLEAKLKATKGKDARDYIKRVINAQHDKLDAAKRSLRK